VDVGDGVMELWTVGNVGRDMRYDLFGVRESELWVELHSASKGFSVHTQFKQIKDNHCRGRMTTATIFQA